MNEESGSTSRQTWGLIIGGALGLLVVGAVLLVTLGAGDGGGDGAAPAATAPPATSPFVAEVPSTIVLPEGDYTGFCTELARARSAFGPSMGVEEARAVYREVDFDAVIAASPSGMQPSLETIRDNRDQVLTALEQIDDFSELAPADLPAGWFQALSVVVTAATQKCQGP